MSFTPTDEPEVQDSDERLAQPDRSEYSLSGRVRLRSLVVGLQRDVAHHQRALRTGLDRLLSPGLVTTERQSFADDIVQPPRCPPVESLPPRAFPLTYPTRAYRIVENDSDLVAEVDERTLRMYHPDGSDAWLRSDTWTQLER